MKTLANIIAYVIALTVLFAVVWIFVKVLGAVFWLLVPICTVAGVTLLLIIMGLVFAFGLGVMWADK